MITLCICVCSVVDMKDACVLCGQFEGSDNEHGNHWVGCSYCELQLYNAHIPDAQVQCDKCPNWHHLQCLDLKADDSKMILQNKKPFFCLACDANDHCFE